MKVLLKEYIHPEAKALLIKHAELTDDIDDIASVDAIILRSLPVTRELMQRAPRLKVIGKHGVGCNTIDLDAARELGITVFNTPTANTNSVAELIVGLILDIARNISLSDAKSRLGQFETIAPASMCGLELTGKTLGLVGLGQRAHTGRYHHRHTVRPASWRRRAYGNSVCHTGHGHHHSGGNKSKEYPHSSGRRACVRNIPLRT